MIIPVMIGKKSVVILSEPSFNEKPICEVFINEYIMDVKTTPIEIYLKRLKQ
ncbi:hypothetical protein [Mycoplasmopsis cynos]|uniref:hypothetical protein n=1 Tax=Mycoplasmopsis cynos TaxID=171284 RepID=UPI0021FA60B5|nr:hypothetical protein [Mycoplasmopsis cynos]MCU9935643.1 hypothetical protein [Mycoplasmopsis cynos]UWV82015.1 hypothetical protein NW065_02960 [Mycoplasmopsis cynos]WAM03184.1 hypothetical protein ONA22_05465 [Mycoplasmopsis cynos]